MNLKQLLQKIALTQNITYDFSLPSELERYACEFVDDLCVSDTMQQAFEISNQEMEYLYRDAYAYYQRGHDAEAAISFRYLVLFNPWMKKYWIGLGATLQVRKKWKKAIEAYRAAYLLDTKDPAPPYYASQCAQYLGDSTLERKLLERAYLQASDPSCQSPLLPLILERRLMLGLS